VQVGNLFAIFGPQQLAAPQKEEFITLLDTISRIALGVIAMITSATLFIPWLGIGVVWGLYEHHNQTKSCSHQHGFAGCGQGFMERMAGTPFRPELSLIANLAVTICHIDHHPTIFVPYSGFALGMWMGQLVDAPLTQAYRWIQKSF
jgi:hypothetical protein